VITFRIYLFLFYCGVLLGYRAVWYYGEIVVEDNTASILF